MRAVLILIPALLIATPTLAAPPPMVPQVLTDPAAAQLPAFGIERDHHIPLLGHLDIFGEAERALGGQHVFVDQLGFQQLTSAWVWMSIATSFL